MQGMQGRGKASGRGCCLGPGLLLQMYMLLRPWLLLSLSAHTPLGPQASSLLPALIQSVTQSVTQSVLLCLLVSQSARQQLHLLHRVHPSQQLPHALPPRAQAAEAE